MIIFELLFLDTPYSECENSYEITENILNGNPPQQPFTLGAEYNSYIHMFRACTLKQASTRPTSSDLITMIKQLPNNDQGSQRIAVLKKDTH